MNPYVEVVVYEMTDFNFTKSQHKATFQVQNISTDAWILILHLV